VGADRSSVSDRRGLRLPNTGPHKPVWTVSFMYGAPACYRCRLNDAADGSKKYASSAVLA
jgi:hypothetical protein